MILVDMFEVFFEIIECNVDVMIDLIDMNF